MYTKQSKKMIAFDILEILRRYTDADHCLSQREIEELLRDKYEMIVDRKTIKRNIDDLIDMGVDIQFSERTRMVYCKDTGEREEQSVCTGFYLQRDIMDCEIRLLIDSVEDADYIAESQKKQLIGKLEGLTSKYFRSGTGSYKMRSDRPAKNQLFYSLEMIHEAMARSSMVRFLYKTYCVSDADVEESYEEHEVAPIDTGICNGRYLLYCKDSSGERRTFRLDYISEMKMLEKPAYRKDLYHMDPGPHEGRIVEFLTEEGMINSFVEFFGGKPFRVARLEDGSIRVSVRTDYERALEFALRNTMQVTLAEPKSLRDRVVKILRGGLDRYPGDPCRDAG